MPVWYGLNENLLAGFQCHTRHVGEVTWMEEGWKSTEGHPLLCEFVCAEAKSLLLENAYGKLMQETNLNVKL